MENILKKSSGRTERFVLAYAIVVVMVFGVLNPLTYVTDFNTAQEISGMGKVVNMDTKTLPYGNVCSSELRQKISMLTMEKNILGSLSVRRNYADLCGMKNREIKHTVVAKNIACTGKSADRETMMDYSDITVANQNISVPIPDKGEDSDLVSGIIEQPIVYPITDNENVLEEPVYIEISGMKIDSEGYVTEILSGAPDGVLAFPTDIRCKGIRSDVFERSDSSLKSETEEVYIPANMCIWMTDFLTVWKMWISYKLQRKIRHIIVSLVFCIMQMEALHVCHRQEFVNNRKAYVNAPGCS